MKHVFLILLVSAVIVHGGQSHLKASTGDTLDLTELSLEELMEVKVTSVSKKPQELSDAAAAIFLITQKDIHRSGVTSIPEALRMVPGIQVARIDANKWAVTSRGFNDGFANKLLVLIDGRSVYTPAFSGVYWDVQDVVLEDIDRIEVIRGPGSSLWGANAVNGVINIITKEAKDTQGTLITAGAGNEEKGFGTIRQGGKLNDNTQYRAYGKYFKRDSYESPSGKKGVDDWYGARGGFRIDWHPPDKNEVTLQGDIYHGDVGTSYFLQTSCTPCHPTFDTLPNGDTNVRGGNILLRWKHSLSDFSHMALQLYYDRTERDDFYFNEDRDTYDFDFQHNVALNKSHDIVWGLGYRATHDDIKNTPDAFYSPDDRWDNLFNVFLQDEITIIEEKLYLTLGSKFEYNSYTEFEVQPTARILWNPFDNHTLWTSVSRAVRTPSRTEEDVTFEHVRAFLPVTPVISGDDDFQSEELIAYELGYRFTPSENIFLDIATFYHDYDELRTLELRSTEFNFPPPQLLLLTSFDNEMDGKSYGVEFASQWKINKWWNVHAAYTYFQMILDLKSGSTDFGSESAEKMTPHNQVSLRSSMDLPYNFAYDLWLRYVDRLPALDIQSYVTLDTRIAWKPQDDLELSLVGQNLLENHHTEFTRTKVERGVYGKITWKF